MWLIFAIGAAGAAVAALSWLLMEQGRRAWVRHDDHVLREASQTLDESFLFLDISRLRPALWGLGGVLALAVIGLTGQWWSGLPILALLLWGPARLLRGLRCRRQAQFDAQLPDLLQALAGALRAGSGVQPALQHIVAQSLPPLSQEFGLMLREQRMGVSFQEALLQLRVRMPTDACGLVVSALGIAAQTGGSLADTLEGIAQTLRARLHWQGRVRALTAQGRLQSRIMAGLPLLLLVALSQLEPDATAQLWSTPAGWGVLAIVCVLQCIGTVWIRRIMAVDV